MKECIFCNFNDKEVIAENRLAAAFYDKFPVNYGHVLIVPKRHVEDYFKATKEEIYAINDLIFEVKEIIDQKFKPDGYNIGINVGYPAGQTIFHLHFHLIPRYKGDVPDPRGGVRKIKKAVVPFAGEGEKY
jgi:diadenosine tetraphosphate (Ap4A) HIT family hydrolase